LSYEDFAARMEEVDRDVDEAQRSLADHGGTRRRASQQDRLARILAAMPDYLQRAPREEVNDALRELFETIVFDVRGRITRIELRR